MKRIVKQARKRMYGPTKIDYLRLEQMGDSAMQFLFRLQRSVEEPIVQFRNIVGKIAYGVSMMQVAAGQPAYYWQIMTPGAILGIIVGYATFTHRERPQPAAA